jgi:hypothetical protein
MGKERTVALNNQLAIRNIRFGKKQIYLIMKSS